MALFSRQLQPTAATLTAIYTSTGSCVLSSIVICNADTSSDTTFTLAIVKSGESLSNKCYLYYGQDLAASDTWALTAGAVLESGDVIYGKSASGQVSFNIFGDVT